MSNYVQKILPFSCKIMCSLLFKFWLQKLGRDWKLWKNTHQKLEVFLKVCFWAFASGQKCTLTENTDSLKFDLNYLYTYVLVMLPRWSFVGKGTKMLITNQGQQSSSAPESTPMKRCLTWIGNVGHLTLQECWFHHMTLKITIEHFYILFLSLFTGYLTNSQ